MNKVLIIGNGFDRQIGLRTDYFSFLDWMQLEGFGIDREFFNISQSMLLGDISNGRFDSFPRMMTSNKEYYELYKNRRGKRILGFNKYPNSQFLSERVDYKEIYFYLPIILKQPSHDRIKPNIWYCLFQLIRYSHLLEPYNLTISKSLSTYSKLMSIQGNWIDLEGIIKETISEIITEEKILDADFNIIHFCLALMLPSSNIDKGEGWNIVLNKDFIKFNIEKIKRYLINDFLELKQTLTVYLKEVLSTNKISWKQFASSLNEETREELNRDDFGQIISFNYTNFISPHRKVYHVHGDVRDGKNIVFGLDPFKKDKTFHDSGSLSDLEESIFNDQNLAKFTKISQLLALQKNKRENLLIINIEKIVIIGHSIGVQDYSYYFSLIDGNERKITIDCLWYEFNINNEVKEREIEKDFLEVPMTNNELSMQNSLFEMLQQYERYAKKRILHRMIFEGRIKFIKIEIQTIEFILKHYPDYEIF